MEEKRPKSLTFSTQEVGPQERALRRNLLIGSTAFLIGLMTAPFWWPSEMERAAANACWLLAAFGFFCIVQYQIERRIKCPLGTFRIDDQAVEFTSLEGNRLRLKWHQVQWVHFPFMGNEKIHRFPGIILRGKRTTIRLAFQVIRDSDLAMAWESITRHLGADFDFEPGHAFLGGRPSPHGLVYRLLRAVVIGIILFLFIMMTLFAAAAWLPEGASDIFGVGIIIALCLAYLHELLRSNWRRRLRMTMPEFQWPLE